MTTERIIYTYTSDLLRPFCPECGYPVTQDTETPQQPWEEVCPQGHSHTFQLEEEENQNL